MVANIKIFTQSQLIMITFLTSHRQNKYRPVVSHGTNNIECEGCGEKFRLYRIRRNDEARKAKEYFPERAYHDHILNKCQAYKDFNLIVKCKFCDKSFANQKGLSVHCHAIHPSQDKSMIRPWMTHSQKMNKNK